jgi:hypothetical protein
MRQLATARLRIYGFMIILLSSVRKIYHGEHSMFNAAQEGSEQTVPSRIPHWYQGPFKKISHVLLTKSFEIK